MKIVPIIKVTEQCNLRCSFCCYTYMQSQENMDIEVCKTIIKKCVAYNYKNGINDIRIIFHGGEPLLRKQDFFEEIIQYQHKLKAEYQNQISFYNAIQTNGFLLNESWDEFLEKHDFQIGISLDGDEEFNFHKYGTRTTEEVLQNIQRLKEKKLEVGILSVITNKHIGHAKEYYNFLKENNIDKVGLCYCYDDAGKSSVNVQGLGKFLIELFDLYYDSEYYLDIREFNNAIGKLLTGTGSSCTCADRKHCGTYITFDCSGHVFFCDQSHTKSSALGDITRQGLEEIVTCDKYGMLKNEALQFRLSQCIDCEVNDICGSGCFRHDKEGMNYFCEAYKVLYKHIRKKIYEEGKRDG